MSKVKGSGFRFLDPLYVGGVSENGGTLLGAPVTGL